VHGTIGIFGPSQHSTFSLAPNEQGALIATNNPIKRSLCQLPNYKMKFHSAVPVFVLETHFSVVLLILLNISWQNKICRFCCA
jgi:hypothetical protein